MAAERGPLFWWSIVLRLPSPLITLTLQCLRSWAPSNVAVVLYHCDWQTTKENAMRNLTPQLYPAQHAFSLGSASGVDRRGETMSTAAAESLREARPLQGSSLWMMKADAWV